MDKRSRNTLIVLGILAIGWFIVRSQQGSHAISSDFIFEKDTDSIAKVTLSSNTDTLSLVKKDTTWEIFGNDSLIINDIRINDLFSKVLVLKKETMVSKNPDKWNIYSVDEMSGTVLDLYDQNDNNLGHFRFGRSASDWSKNYIRIGSENEVYLTSENVMYRLNPTDTFWGKKPEPPKELLDQLENTILDTVGK